jgi:hypothetical protein
MYSLSPIQWRRSQPGPMRASTGDSSRIGPTQAHRSVPSHASPAGSGPGIQSAVDVHIRRTHHVVEPDAGRGCGSTESRRADPRIRTPWPPADGDRRRHGDLTLPSKAWIENAYHATAAGGCGSHNRRTNLRCRGRRLVTHDPGALSVFRRGWRRVRSALMVRRPRCSRSSRRPPRVEHEIDTTCVAFGIWLCRRTRGCIARLSHRRAIVLTDDRPAVCAASDGSGPSLPRRYALARGSSGLSRPPGWYFNLLAEPRTVGELDGRRPQLRAGPLSVVRQRTNGKN